MLEVMDEHKTWVDGKKVGNKLRRREVLRIVRLAKDPRNTSTILGKMFGVTRRTIAHILKQFGCGRPRGRPKKE